MLVPLSMRREILRTQHDLPIADHQLFERTLRNIRFILSGCDVYLIKIKVSHYFYCVLLHVRASQIK
jgi:hypothetical protein